jgi:hypothetical protein
VALSNDGQTVAIGATFNDGAGDNAGHVRVYEFFDADTTPPVIAPPGNITVQENVFGDTIVEYPDVEVSDDVDPNPEVSFHPASGTALPVGDTEVTVTATDESGNSAYATFQVTVIALSPLDALTQLRDAVTNLELPYGDPGGKGVERGFLNLLDSAFDNLEDHDPDNVEAAIGKLQAFIEKVEAQRGNRINDDDADALATAARRNIESITDELFQAPLTTDLDEE